MGAIEARATLSNLGAVAGAAPLEQLTKPQLQELQIALSLLGYPIGAIDGLIRAMPGPSSSRMSSRAIHSSSGPSPSTGFGRTS